MEHIFENYSSVTNEGSHLKSGVIILVALLIRQRDEHLLLSIHYIMETFI